MVVAIIVAIFGWWVYGRVQDSMRAKISSGISTVLHADINALDQWMENQRNLASTAAILPNIQKVIAELVALQLDSNANRETILQSAQLAAIRGHLKPIVKLHNYTDFIVTDRTGRMVASLFDEPIGVFIQTKQTEFFRSIFEGETTVSLPYIEASPSLGSEKNTTMLVGTPIRSEDGNIVAALSFRIRPEKDFLPIFAVTRPGTTGETYVIDKQGRMLSPSRFTAELKEIGLIAANEDTSPVLTLEIRDPGGDLSAGYKPTAERANQPLTKSATKAIAGGSGVDVKGYRNYRGIEVVGAWKWIDDYNLGVIMEIETKEAFRALHFLCKLVWSLVALLMLISLAFMFSSGIVARLRRRVKEASKVGHYKLEKKIGEGGMGEVYLASHAMLERPTAIKVLRPDCGSEECITRFEREVQNTSKLTHPNTVAIYDFGRTPDARFYYAMEFLDGVSLSELVKREGPLPEARVIHILQQVCESLAEAHAAELIHRDIKPANIMLCRLGLKHDFVKVLDFGLVKSFADDNDEQLTRVDVVTGTPGFMAPELAQEGGVVDVRADIYALGCVGYWLLTGHQVFENKNTVAMLVDHVKTKPTPPSSRSELSVSADIDQIILACLEKNPDDRPQSAHALRSTLLKCSVAGQWTEEHAKQWWDLRGPSTDNFVPTPDAPGLEGNRQLA